MEGNLPGAKEELLLLLFVCVCVGLENTHLSQNSQIRLPEELCFVTLRCFVIIIILTLSVQILPLKYI